MAFPTTGILDNFNRANANPLDGSWAVAPYNTSFTQLKIVSSEVTMVTTNANDALYYYTGDTAIGPDFEVFVDVGTVSVTQHFIIIGGRYDATGNGYKLDWDAGASRVRVWRDSSGTRTQLGLNITQALNTKASIGMSMIDTLITVYYKTSGGSWASIGTRTDSTWTTAGRLHLGMWLSTGSRSMDNFGGGTIGVTSISAVMTPRSGYWGDL